MFAKQSARFSLPDPQQWMDADAEQAGVKGCLYIRIEKDKTTFMESYHDISRATIERIEKLASSTALFDGIQRRSESFIQIVP